LQLLKFDRSGFKAKGPLELASEELIKMAAAGNFLRVEELLNAGTVHPDVADRNGHNALIGATVSLRPRMCVCVCVFCHTCCRGQNTF
jgi:hypothetical protein